MAAFAGILPFDAGGQLINTEPHYFRDLNLDQIVESITAEKTEYELKPFFYSAVHAARTVTYRQDVFRDLESPAVFHCIKAFARNMQQTRQKRIQGEKLYYEHQKTRWSLHAAESYCAAVIQLHDEIAPLELSSAGLSGFRTELDAYIGSERFVQLSESATALAADLAKIEYSAIVRDNGFTVRPYEPHPDYSEEIEAIFKKFQQEEGKTYLVKFRGQPAMNHIEAQILDFVARLNPETFSRLADFTREHANHVDPLLANFEKEIQFYVSYLEHIAPLKLAGLSFCYPEISAQDKDVHSEAAFDLALAKKLVDSKSKIVCNGFHLSGTERVIVVSGPNQGGKTTFARSFGQLHHLASLGLPIPGRSSKLFLFDSIFTHFEREEAAANLHGKLQDDLLRIQDILKTATGRSLIIMNEIFSSTSLQDAVFLARKVLNRIIELGTLCVCVTFLEELSLMSDEMVSMVSTVLPEDPTSRTFEVVRRPADGRSYAISIAEKYRLTYEQLLRRMDFE